MLSYLARRSAVAFTIREFAVSQPPQWHAPKQPVANVATRGNTTSQSTPSRLKHLVVHLVVGRGRSNLQHTTIEAGEVKHLSMRPRRQLRNHGPPYPNPQRTPTSTKILAWPDTWQSHASTWQRVGSAWQTNEKSYSIPEYAVQYSLSTSVEKIHSSCVDGVSHSLQYKEWRYDTKLSQSTPHRDT